MACNVHALAMAGQFMIFRRNLSPVNEQKVDIFILLLNRDFSAGTTAQKRIKSWWNARHAQLLPMRLLAADLFLTILFVKSFYAVEST